MNVLLDATLVQVDYLSSCEVLVGSVKKDQGDHSDFWTHVTSTRLDYKNDPHFLPTLLGINYGVVKQTFTRYIYIYIYANFYKR